MATGSWTGTTPRGVYKPAMNEKEGTSTTGAWKNFDTSLTNIHNKLWRDNVINVKSDYGATGDGTTNDVDAINDAIALATTLGGGTVLVPATTQKYSLASATPGYIQLASNVRLMGLGFPEIYQSAEGEIHINIPDGSSNVEVSGFKFTGTGLFSNDEATYAGRSAIDIAQEGVTSGVSNVWIHHNIITDVSACGISAAGTAGLWIYENYIDISNTGEHGIYIVGPVDSIGNIWIRNNIVFGPGCKTGGSHGIRLDNGIDCWILNNKVDSCATPIDVRPAGYTGEEGDQTVRNVEVRGNTVTNADSLAASTCSTSGGSKTTDVKWIDNKIYDMAGGDALSTNCGGGLVIANNLIRDQTGAYYGIRSSGTNTYHINTLIAGNILIDNVNGIRVDDPGNDFVVQNNFITGSSAGRGIRFLSVSVATGIIRDNTIYNCDTPIQTDATYPQRGNITARGGGGDNTVGETVTAASPTLKAWGYTEIDSTNNAVGATLGSGQYIGQIKTIVMTDATNASTVTVTNHNLSDGEVFDFNAVDDTLVLLWNGTEWITLGEEGVGRTWS